MKDRKHVWPLTDELNKILKSRTDFQSRYSDYSISNWELLVKEPSPTGKGTKPKGAFS